MGKSLLSSIATGLFAALAFLHQESIAHRDVKPANVLWDKSARRVVLADFGLACTLRDNPLLPDCAPRLGFCGTLAYTSHERWLAKRQHRISSAQELEANDVWGACITLYVVLFYKGSLSRRAGSREHIEHWLNKSQDEFLKLLNLRPAAQLYSTAPDMAELILSGLVPIANRPTAAELLSAWSAYEE
jgi:serine/threonine protein kinase